MCQHRHQVQVSYGEVTKCLTQPSSQAVLSMYCKLTEQVPLGLHEQMHAVCNCCMTAMQTQKQCKSEEL